MGVELAVGNAASHWTAMARARGWAWIDGPGFTAVRSDHAHRVLLAAEPIADAAALRRELLAVFREWDSRQVCVEDPTQSLDFTDLGFEAALTMPVMVREPGAPELESRRRRTQRPGVASPRESTAGARSSDARSVGAGVPPERGPDAPTSGDRAPAGPSAVRPPTVEPPTVEPLTGEPPTGGPPVSGPPTGGPSTGEQPTVAPSTGALLTGGPPAGDLSVGEALSEEDRAAVERVVVEGFPILQRLPWRRGEQFPADAVVPGQRSWLARVDGRPAAACVTHDDGVAVGFYWVVTLPEFRSRGAGRAVVRAGLAAYPHRPATLTATLLGEPLYRRLGFTERGLARWWQFPATPAGLRR